MKIISLKDAPRTKNPHNVQACKVYDTENAIVVHMTLEPGEKLKRHKTPVDVFFVILEGKPSIEVGDEKIQVEKDQLIESPANIVHCIYNETDEPARILVVKVPKPSSKTKII
ncbi:MAG: cupin domain-containing protein [Candidatus Eremiobacteraeota bacterium]|nr:cupin domain-containing protein [Candidatus Eremiobacteraeota bacterium]